MVSEYDTAAGLVRLWWTYLYEYVDLLYTQCGRECRDMYCLFQGRGSTEKVEEVYD